MWNRYLFQIAAVLIKNKNKLCKTLHDQSKFRLKTFDFIYFTGFWIETVHTAKWVDKNDNPNKYTKLLYWGI